MNGTFSGSLKINSDQITAGSLDMHLNEGSNRCLNKLFTEPSVVTPASKGPGEHRPAHLGKESMTMILVDPLSEDNSRCPLSVSPYYFQNPVRVQEMERISFAGQHTGRGGKLMAEDTYRRDATRNSL